MKIFFRSNFNHILLVIFFVFLFSCNNTVKNSSISLDDSIDKIKKVDLAYNKAKTIFYSLPSPIETAMVLEEAGVTFDSEVINPIENLQNYSTSKKLALNLGIYSTDLSYCSLFNQPQLILNYLLTSKKIADQLGIIKAISDSTIDELKANLKNKNQVMSIISEIFRKSNVYLSENNRSEIATMIVIGGWIEALYISLQLSENINVKTISLKEIIYDQRLSLEDLIGLVEIYKENPDITGLISDLNKIKSVYSKMVTPITQEQLSNLNSTVVALRNEYTR